MKKLITILILLVFASCNLPEPPKRHYYVKVIRDPINVMGMSSFTCDTIIWISENRFKLKNNEDSLAFIDFIIPYDAEVKIKPIK